MAACQCSEGRGGFGGGLHAGGGGTVASCSPVKNGKVSGPQTNAVSSWFLGVCFCTVKRASFCFEAAFKIHNFPKGRLPAEL